MKQPTSSTSSNSHGGGNPIRIGGLINACRMMRITDDLKVLFRNPRLLGGGFAHKEVPYIQVPRTPDPSDPNGVPIERYYFCSRYMVQASVYLPILFKTQHLEDDEIGEVPHMLNDEERVLDMKLSADNHKNSQCPYELRMALFGKCVHKYYNKGYNRLEVARMLFTTEIGVKRYLNSKAQVLSSPAEPKRGRLRDAIEYRAIQEQVKAARVKAHNSSPRITGSFTASDVLPTMYDVQGNSGRDNGAFIVPKVCPVLRIPLDYNIFENKSALNKIRVWRKTSGPDGTAPIDKDNVTIMSKAAARILEGAHAASVLNSLTGDAHAALAEWQAKYGTRTVPRETRIGRPKKAGV